MSQTGIASLSTLSTTEILRSVADRIAQDGTRDAGILELLNAIATNTSLCGAPPMRSSLISSAATTRIIAAKCPIDHRIIVCDMILSINGITTILFTDQNASSVLPTFRAPNAGQGFIINSPRGIPLPLNKDLYVNSSLAIQYDFFCTYFVVEEVSHD